jgi:hypothetical protein
MAARKSRSKAKAARPTTVAAYLASLAPEKRAVIEEVRALVHRHIPKGYAEFMNWVRTVGSVRRADPTCRAACAPASAWTQ